MNPKVSIAYFISSHGFGHAARASAVINALHDLCPFFHFEIFSQTPQWFFRQSLIHPFGYHLVETDIGLVQTSPLHFDLLKTIDILNRFLPFNASCVDILAEKVSEYHCQLIISDISPLGIAVGKAANIKTVLIENFTWDWIYHAYLPSDGRFKTIIDYLKNLYGAADYRIQAEPVCDIKAMSLKIPPISRTPVTSRQEIRSQLGVTENEKMVLITMGGIHQPFPWLEQIRNFQKDIYFVVPGGNIDLPSSDEKSENVILLPQASEYYHPDLMHAADAVIGKVGYSTLAEAFHAGVPFGYVNRANFPESFSLEQFILSRMNGLAIAEQDLHAGKWLDQLSKLLAHDISRPKTINGAKMAADYIRGILIRECEIIEIVDSNSVVIGAAPRDKVHGNNQWVHRVVHVLVFDMNNRLLLQKRALSKTVAPGKWDTSVGGHVDFGESVEKAVCREMAEELGIPTASLQYLYQYTHKNNFESELVCTYKCIYDGDIRYNREEIDEVRYWDLAEINADLIDTIFSDNFKDEFARYCMWMGNRKS